MVPIVKSVCSARNRHKWRVPKNQVIFPVQAFPNQLGVEIWPISPVAPAPRCHEHYQTCKSADPEFIVLHRFCQSCSGSI